MTQRILAIGDIHGCARALDALLAAVAPMPEDLIVTLGDYVDRGLDSSGVLDRLIRLHLTHRLIPLRGNHEEMMMDARQSRQHFMLWLNCGGDSALECYGSGGYSQAMARIPDEHWNFFDNVCVNWFETETHIFVHACIRPEAPLEQQSITDLRWRRWDDPTPHVSGKIVICGHTPQESGVPRSLGHAICIDTGACGDGWLTCLDVRSGEIWQANEAREVRRSRLGVPVT